MKWLAFNGPGESQVPLYNSPTEYQQSWFMEPPGKDETCVYFWNRSGK